MLANPDPPVERRPAATRFPEPRHPSGRRWRVACVTPLGPDGRGGIDRLFRYVRERPADDGEFEIRYLVSRGEAPGLLWLLTFPWHLARIAGVLATWRPDLLHVNYANGGSVPRKLAVAGVSRLMGCPLLLHLHCVFPSADLDKGKPGARMALALARTASHVIAIGRRAERAFVDVAHIDPARVHVVANGVPDIGEGLAIPKRNAALKILFAGEIGPRKGTSVLIEALARLRDVPGWTCTVAGNGAVEECRASVRELGLSGRVDVLGWRSSDAVHRLMRDADVVVLPSAREVMPMSLIEGAAAGAALLATPVGEVPDVVEDGTNGFLIDRDPGRLADRLRLLLDDRDLLSRMQSESRRLFEARFRLDVFVEHLHAVYAEVLAQAR